MEQFGETPLRHMTPDGDLHGPTCMDQPVAKIYCWQDNEDFLRAFLVGSPLRDAGASALIWITLLHGIWFWLLRMEHDKKAKLPRVQKTMKRWFHQGWSGAGAVSQEHVRPAKGCKRACST